LKLLQEYLVATKIKCKTQFDKNRHACELVPGEEVLLDTTNLGLVHVGTSGKRKWAPRFIGPYEVAAKTTPNTYKLKLPPGIRIHDEFHVAYLRKYPMDLHESRINTVSKVTLGNNETGFLVRRIIDKKIKDKIVYYKVNWLGYGKDHDSWEPYTGLGQVQGLIDNFENEIRITELLEPCGGKTSTVPIPKSNVNVKKRKQPSRSAKTG
jgi:hypothetical protein